MNTHPVHIILILSTQSNFPLTRLGTGFNWLIAGPQIPNLHFGAQDLSHINPKKSRENYLKLRFLYRPFGGCGSASQIGSDRKLGKCQISISKQMYHTVTLLMEIINISSLDFYFRQSTRLFISPRTRVKKLGAAPWGLQTFTHHLI